MSKELDEFYKKYSARIIAVDDPPVKVMNGGKFKLLSIEEYNNLNQQLEQLKKFDDLNKTFFDLFRTAFKEPNEVDDLFNTLKTMQEKQDQDKISFAVEQLEWLKEKVNNAKIHKINMINTHELYEVLDNRIKLLKEGK